MKLYLLIYLGYLFDIQQTMISLVRLGVACQNFYIHLKTSDLLRATSDFDLAELASVHFFGLLKTGSLLMV